MKRNISEIIMALVLVFLLSGCGGNTAEVKLVSAPIVTEAPAETAAPTKTAVTDTYETPEAGTPVPNAAVTPTPAPTEKPTKELAPDVYFTEGYRLYRKHNGEDLLVYVAIPHFPSGWTCRLNNLLVENGVLYFTEEGMPGDDYTESLYRIIRMDSYGCTELDKKYVTGYTQLISYGSRIIFVQDGSDSQEIGWANKDGSASAYLNFSNYAAQYSVEQYYNNATIYMKDDGKLYADIAFYTNGDPEIVDHTVSISKDLKIERVK